MILQSIGHHASCEASSESTVHLTEDSPHHAKCQKLITFTGFNYTDTPKGHISKLHVEGHHYLDVSSLHPQSLYDLSFDLVALQNYNHNYNT